jgi:hypothetical protein
MIEREKTNFVWKMLEKLRCIKITLREMEIFDPCTRSGMLDICHMKSLPQSLDDFSIIR